MTTTHPRVLPTTGQPTRIAGHLGAWTLSLGPHSVIPGERLMVVLLDETGTVRRRLEQIRGENIDPGYVDFFHSAKCRPSRDYMPVVDLDAEGNIQQSYGELTNDTLPQTILAWATQHGRPEWAL